MPQLVALGRTVATIKDRADVLTVPRAGATTAAAAPTGTPKRCGSRGFWVLPASVLAREVFNRGRRSAAADRPQNADVPSERTGQRP